MALALEELCPSEVYEAEEDAETPSKFLARSILIDCFLQLAVRLTPQLSNEDEQAMRGNAIPWLPSVLSWLPRLPLQFRGLVSGVRLEYINEPRNLDETSRYHMAQVAFSDSPVEVVTLPSAVGKGCKCHTVAVNQQSSPLIDPLLLAVALSPDYSNPFNFVLDNSDCMRGLIEGSLVILKMSSTASLGKPSNQSNSLGTPKSTKGKMKQNGGNVSPVALKVRFFLCFFKQ